MYELELGGQLGSITFDQVGNNRYVLIPTKASTIFFKEIGVKYTDIAANALGLYTLGSIGRNGEGVFMSIDTPKHLLTSRKDGCLWKSKGHVRNSVTKIELCPIEYQGQQCPDEFYGSCLESIFDVGNGVRDLFGTEESKALMQQLLDKIWLGLGNSLFELASHGDHPFIEESDDNAYYKVDQKEWEDYKDQEAACTGWYTRIDYLKDVEGRDNLNVQISPDEVNGADFIGDPEDVFRRLTAVAKGPFATVIKSRSYRGLSPIILVSDGIYSAYENKLMNKFPCIPDMYQFYLKGMTDDKVLMPGILKWGGYWIVRDDSQELFDSITGAITHRALLTVPGNFGLITDVQNLNQYDGMGLRLVQKLDPPDNGMVYMDTTFKMATGILNVNYMANASLILTPEI